MDPKTLAEPCRACKKLVSGQCTNNGGICAEAHQALFEKGGVVPPVAETPATPTEQPAPEPPTDGPLQNLCPIPRNITRLGLSDSLLADLLRAYLDGETRDPSNMDFFERSGLIQIQDGDILFHMIPDSDIEELSARIAEAEKAGESL